MNLGLCCVSIRRLYGWKINAQFIENAYLVQYDGFEAIGLSHGILLGYWPGLSHEARRRFMASNSYSGVAPQFAIERGARDAEFAGGSGDISAVALQGRLNGLHLDRLQPATAVFRASRRLRDFCR